MLRVIAGLAVIAVLAAAGWWWLSDGESAAAPQRPATTVNVVPAISRPLSDNLEVVGTARATRASTWQPSPKIVFRIWVHRSRRTHCVLSFC